MWPKPSTAPFTEKENGRKRPPLKIPNLSAMKMDLKGEEKTEAVPAEVVPVKEVLGEAILENDATNVAKLAIFLVPVGNMGEEPRIKVPTVQIIPEAATSKAKASPEATTRVFETLLALASLVNVCYLVDRR